MNKQTYKFWPPGRDRSGPAPRVCDHAGCRAEGQYRAPKSRESLREYYWFCLEHVRAYNSSWDFCAGMTQEEIESLVRSSITWERTSWPLGRRMSSRFFRIEPERVKDSFGLFGEEFWSRPSAPPAPPSPEEKAKRVMELSGALTLISLKSRYKELCKRHHPDANDGDKAAEERFKEIGQAYRTLLASLSY